MSAMHLALNCRTSVRATQRRSCHAARPGLSDQVVSSAVVLENAQNQEEALLISSIWGRDERLAQHELTRNPYITLYNDHHEPEDITATAAAAATPGTATRGASRTRRTLLPPQPDTASQTMPFSPDLQAQQQPQLQQPQQQPSVQQQPAVAVASTVQQPLQVESLQGAPQPINGSESVASSHQQGPGPGSTAIRLGPNSTVSPSPTLAATPGSNRRRWRRNQSQPHATSQPAGTLGHAQPHALSLSDALEQLEAVLHSPGIAHAAADLQQPPHPAIPSYHKNPGNHALAASSPVTAHRSPAQVSGLSNTPTSPLHLNYMQLLHQISTATDVQAACNLWDSHSPSMQVQHVTAMWVRLGELVQRADPVSVETGGEEGDGGSSGSGEGRGSQRSRATGSTPSTPASHAMKTEEAAAQVQALRTGLSPPTLRLWGCLVSTGCFQAPTASVAQIATVLRVHSALQGRLGTLVRLEATTDAAQRLAAKRFAERWQADAEADVEGGGGNGDAERETEIGLLAAGDESGWQAETEGEGHGEPTPPEWETQSGLEAADESRADEALQAVAAVAAPHGVAVSGVTGRMGYGDGWPRPRPTHGTRTSLPAGLSRPSRHAFLLSLLSAARPALPQATIRDLTSLLRSCVQLRHRPDAAWLNVWWAAAEPLFAGASLPLLISVFRSTGYLGWQPPRGSVSALLSATQPHLASASVRELCGLAHGAARLKAPPPAAWTAELVSACERQFDAFDAPAYALILHALGRMRHRPHAGWIHEFWDSAASLLNDFSTQELSLLLRGAAYLRTPPEPHLLAPLWRDSAPRLKEARGSAELANLGWAVLVALGLRPPRQWVAAWLAALNKQCMASAASRAMPMPTGPARRAASTLAAIGVPDLPEWCYRLGVAVPTETLPMAPLEASASDREVNRGVPGATGATGTIGMTGTVAAPSSFWEPPPRSPAGNAPAGPASFWEPPASPASSSAGGGSVSAWDREGFPRAPGGVGAAPAVNAPPFSPLAWSTSPGQRKREEQLGTEPAGPVGLASSGWKGGNGRYQQGDADEVVVVDHSQSVIHGGGKSEGHVNGGVNGVNGYGHTRNGHARVVEGAAMLQAAEIAS